MLARDQVATQADADAEAVFRTLADLVRSVARRCSDRLAMCGVGCGGPMAGDLVSPLNIPAWRGFPLRQRLASDLGLATFVDNDAKALALAEGWLGAAAGDEPLSLLTSSNLRTRPNPGRW